MLCQRLLAGISLPTLGKLVPTCLLDLKETVLTNLRQILIGMRPPSKLHCMLAERGLNNHNPAFVRATVPGNTM